MNQTLFLMREREHLIHSITEALRSIPGAISLHTFGSDARGEEDCYSDIDLQLITTNLDHSIEMRGEVLRRVAPVAVEWVIAETTTSWAATVLFDDASPYHKLDIGFCAEHAEDMSWILSGSLTTWVQTPGAFVVDAPDEPDLSCSPSTGSVEHLVLGELIGLTRYVKARRRTQELVCWRFFQALLNRTLLFQYISTIDPSRSPATALLTHEYTMLQRCLLPRTREQLREILAIANPAAMDRSVVHLARMLAHVAFDGKPASVACQREIDRLLSWLKKELDVQDEPNALW